MNKSNEKFVHISDQNDLNYLIKQIDSNLPFAQAFKFKDYTHFLKLLEHLNIDYDEFKKRYFHFDRSCNLHISESEFKYIWISTNGLVAKDKTTDNNYVNACVNQYTTLSLLIEKAIEVSVSENVYDVDRFNFGYLSSLTPALFQNTLFYLEVFGKAYLSLSKEKVPHTHTLSKVYGLVSETMYKKKHNDTLFQALIIDEFMKITEYVSSIPGGFKEHFVKYDDNSEDSTVIVFDPDYIAGLNQVIEIANDFIYEYYYDIDGSFCLKPGLLERLIKKAQTEDEKQGIIDKYAHLVANYKTK